MAPIIIGALVARWRWCCAFRTQNMWVVVVQQWWWSIGTAVGLMEVGWQLGHIRKLGYPNCRECGRKFEGIIIF